MSRILKIFFFLIFVTEVNADNKEKILTNLKNTSNLSFQFEQNINGKIERGKCIIEYPKKFIVNIIKKIKF